MGRRGSDFRGGGNGGGEVVGAGGRGDDRVGDGLMLCTSQGFTHVFVAVSEPGPDRAGLDPQW